MISNVPTICVRKLGQVGFKEAFRLQKEAYQNVLETMYNSNSKFANGYLFLVEHNPVYTVGIRNKQYIQDEQKLKALGADFIVTDRGGLITFHGPGQLVCYPVIYLGNFCAKKSIKWYVRQLENCVIGTCADFGLKATLTKDVGIWIDNKKIAAIGIHASRYITTHGVAINSNVDLNWFSHIVPCGLANKGVTSLSEELRRNVTVEET
ncbi:putative lipoyltransferase 2, mitochondrial, partial [Stegodyphus mimosarum]